MARDGCGKSYSVKNKTSKASTTEHQQDRPTVGNTKDRKNAYSKPEYKILKYCACVQNRQEWGIPIHLETSGGLRPKHLSTMDGQQKGSLLVQFKL